MSFDARNNSSTRSSRGLPGDLPVSSDHRAVLNLKSQALDLAIPPSMLATDEVIE
jgi:hypothetical protein